MANSKSLGIRYPFTNESLAKTFIDLDYDMGDVVKSELMHLIFTPKGQRIRNPEFGTRLINFIFSPNDNDTWGDVKQEIKEAVSKFMPSVNLTNISVYQEDTYGLIARIDYTVDNGSTISEQTITTRL